jgi:hypothetical protein
MLALGQKQDKISNTMNFKYLVKEHVKEGMMMQML